MFAHLSTLALASNTELSFQVWGQSVVVSIGLTYVIEENILVYASSDFIEAFAQWFYTALWVRVAVEAEGGLGLLWEGKVGLGGSLEDFEQNLSNFSWDGIFWGYSLTLFSIVFKLLCVLEFEISSTINKNNEYKLYL